MIMKMKTSTKFKETEIGAIPEEWDIFDIQTVSEVVGGGTPSTTNENNFNGDIPWITPRDLSSYQDRFISRGERCISEEGLNSSNAKLLPVNTVLLTTRAPVGYLAIAKNEVTTNQGFHSLIPNNKTNSLFLFYLLKNNVEKLISNASGSTFQELNGKTLKSLEFAFPRINEQEQIAEILSSLDDKIELNRKINANLEKLASSLFKKWFVDIGDELPEGWRMGKFSDITEITSGKRPSNNKDVQTDEFKIPLLGASSIMGYVKEYLYNEPILITGRVGTHGIIQKVDYPCWPSDNTLVIKSKFLEFAYHVMKSIDFASLNRGSTQPLITQGDLKNIDIRIPEKTALEKFEEMTAPFVEMVRNNETENQNLSKIRDSLLPRLMSGKIRVNI
jgi:type I restriction enzyme S subunit